MTDIKEHLANTERIEHQFKPSRKAFLGEYLLFIFVMLLSFTSLYPLIMSKFKTIAILGIIAQVIFYILFTISIILLIKVEYKIWSILYVLTNHRIMISKGIFTEQFTSITYNKITNIALEQRFIDKILNVGKIEIETASGDHIEGVLEKISNPIYIKKSITDLETKVKIDVTSQSTNNPTHHSHRR